LALASASRSSLKLSTKDNGPKIPDAARSAVARQRRALAETEARLNREKIAIIIRSLRTRSAFIGGDLDEVDRLALAPAALSALNARTAAGANMVRNGARMGDACH
jgi:hypothetical protein